MRGQRVGDHERVAVVGAVIITGDCLAAMRAMDAASVDAVVTDPPYDLAFMGKSWDQTGVAFRVETWAEVLRVLKPGGYLLAFGGPRTWHRLAVAIEDSGFYLTDSLCWLFGSGFPKAKSCLKPAWEPIILARKRAERVLPLQIDACRIAGETTIRTANKPGVLHFGGQNHRPHHDGPNHHRETGSSLGRWPANVCLDEDAAQALDGQSGITKSSGGINDDGLRGLVYRGFPNVKKHAHAGGLGDTGGASRFYYVPKASRSERNAGLDGEQSSHPTVKPIALMRWLVRLVTPPGGTVLDPFLGSGSTGVAAVLEGFDFIGIEREAEYAEIARRRIEYAIGPLLATVGQ